MEEEWKHNCVAELLKNNQGTPKLSCQNGGVTQVLKKEVEQEIKHKQLTLCDSFGCWTIV